MAAGDPQIRIATLEMALRTSSRELHWAQLTIQKKDAVIQQLLEQLRKQRIGFLGPSSETLSDLQLELLSEQEPSTTCEEVEAESRREPIAEPRARKPHPGRKPLPGNLPRIEEVVACDASCARCGGATAVIGYDSSEVLDREPAKWFVRVTKRGYQAYDQVGGPGLIHVGCWAHARRKFVDAVKVNPKDGAAIAMVTRMDALFLVDRHAREQKLGADERAALRLEHARPWVDEIYSECVKLRSQLLPKSALGEAVNYTLNMWTKLRRCFDHAEVELSNNVAENSMRPIAVGRKNWLHVGSAKSGPKVAAILSVVESCRRVSVPVKEYLLAVLPGMNQRKVSEVAKLTPARWNAARA